MTISFDRFVDSTTVEHGRHACLDWLPIAFPSRRDREFESVFLQRWVSSDSDRNPLSQTGAPRFRTIAPGAQPPLVAEGTPDGSGCPDRQNGLSSTK